MDFLPAKFLVHIWLHSLVTHLFVIVAILTAHLYALKHDAEQNKLGQQKVQTCAKVELLQVYFWYTLNILHLKTDIIKISYNPQQ